MCRSPPLQFSPMLSKRITRVTLTRTVEDADGLTSHAGAELWRVEWGSIGTAGRTDTSRAAHYTEKAAWRHVANLLELRAEGLDVGDVYRENC